MRRLRKFLGVVFAFCLLAAMGSAADPGREAFQPGELWLDNHGQAINAHGGGILFYEGIYYWFGEHKIAGPIGNSAQVGVHVYSSKDLYNWNDEGIALPVSEDPSSDIAKGCILERPKVLFNQQTGKFVMWFHLELKGHGYRAARSGVAVSHRPIGPYQFLYSLRPNAGVWPENFPADERRPLSGQEQADHGLAADSVFRRDFEKGQMARDMTLFLDDDGRAYHIYASEENGTLQISQLNSEFTWPAGRYTRVMIGGFNEAPALFKKDGHYYLFASGTTGWRPNACRSYTATNIFGPWTSLGNPCRGTEEQNKITFDSQPTFVVAAPGHEGQFIFMADRWRPRNPIDGRYVWLPIVFDHGRPVLEWKENWKLDGFDRHGGS